MGLDYKEIIAATKQQPISNEVVATEMKHI